MKKLFLVSLLVLPLFTSCGSSSKTYTVTWDLDNGSEVIKEKYKKGALPSYKGKEPTKEGTGPLSEEDKRAGKDECTYAFKGWDKELAPVNSNVTYKAVYNVHSLVTRISFKMDTVTKGKKVGFDFTYLAGEKDVFVNWGDQECTSEVTEVGAEVYHIEHIYDISIRKDFSILVYGSLASLKNLNTNDVLVDLKLSNTNTVIDGYSLWNNETINSVFISSTIKTIEDHAFAYCTNLTSVTFENDSQLKEINDCAFFICAGLTSVTFEGSSQLETIGDCAFEKTALTSIVIPRSTKTIDNDAFCDCASLTSVTFEGSSQLETIGDRAFENTALTSIVIPRSTKTIDNDAFCNCASLTSVTFEGSSQLETIGDRAFEKTALTSIVIPKSTKTIGDSAFYICEFLSSLTFEKDSRLEIIDGMAFAMCDLTSVKIPKSTKTIGNLAFVVKNNLTVVDLTDFTDENVDKIPSISEGTFTNSTSLMFYVANDNMYSIFTTASVWSNYASQFTTEPVPQSI